MADRRDNPEWTRLAPEQREAWIGFLRAHAQVVKQLDDELEAEHGLPLTSYDVLVQLARAGAEGMQMCDLAEAIVLSRSGLTRLVERLEREGLVARRRGEQDSRTVFAAVTDAGRRRVRETSPTHLDGVRRRFLARLSDDDLRHLARIWDLIRAD
jgi:DNA-binding MarR family transcriptional regulator